MLRRLTTRFPFRSIHSTGFYLARKRPGVATSAQIPREPMDDLPSDFDKIADELLGQWDTQQTPKRPTIQQEERIIEKVEYKGPDEDFNELPKEPELAAHEIQAHLAKEANKSEENFEPAEPEFETRKTIPKLDMNDFYDSRHEFGQENAPPDDMSWFENKVFNISPQESTPRWLKGVERGLKRQQESTTEFDSTGNITVNEIVNRLELDAAFNISVIDVREKCDHMDAVIICEGRSQRHIYSLADSVRRMSKHRYEKENYLADNLEVQGKNSEDWMLVDLGRYMVHCFTPSARVEMDIEGIWSDSIQLAKK